MPRIARGVRWCPSRGNPTVNRGGSVPRNRNNTLVGVISRCPFTLLHKHGGSPDCLGRRCTGLSVVGPLTSEVWACRMD